MKRKDNINTNDNLQNENIPTIKFMRKKIRSRFILSLKIISFFIITVAISTGTSILVYNYKNKALVEETNDGIKSGNINMKYSTAIDNVKNSLVTIGGSKEDLKNDTYMEGNTTGIIIDEDGKILTSYSIIKTLEDIYVNLSFVGSEPLKAEVVITNEDIDIAILKVDCKEKLTPIKIATRDEIVEGEKILLISNSTGDEYIDNLVPGIITATNRQFVIENKKYNLFEINTPINKFNNGGIICNLNGEVIAVASMKLTDDMDVDGLYYAIDLSALENIVDYTNEIKAILGIAEGGFIKENGDYYSGIYVARVNENEDLYENMLRSTDIIFEIDGIKINNIPQILELLKNKENGDTVTCKVMRSGKVIEVHINIK